MDSSQLHLGRVAAITFGGSDLKTVYLGSATARRCAMFRSAVAGMVPAHWAVNIPTIKYGVFARPASMGVSL
jgi:hypothetical protein